MQSLESWTDAYEVVGRLGVGASGTVELGRQRASGRLVAIRVLAPELAADQGMRAQLRGQADVLGRIREPNNVSVIEYLENEGAVALVSEYVDGASARYLLRDGPLRVLDALGVLEDVLTSLDHAHERGIVHGDIRPDNIFVDRAGVAKVADYGLNTAIVGHVGALPATIPSRAYASPEVVAGEPLDAGSDLYSTAVVLCELITGQPPVHGISLQDITLRDVPEPVVSLMLKALDRDKGRRPDSAAAFLGELRGAGRRTFGRKWHDRAVLGALVAETGAAVTVAAAGRPSAGGPPGAAGTGATAGAMGTAGVAGQAKRGSRFRRLRANAAGHPRLALTAVALLVAASVAAGVTLSGSGGRPPSAAPVTQSSGGAPTPPAGAASTSVVGPGSTAVPGGPSPPEPQTRASSGATPAAGARHGASKSPSKTTTRRPSQPLPSVTAQALWTVEAQFSGPAVLSSISCPTPSDCWAVGGSSAAAALVVATRNGGASWSVQTLPPGVRYLNGISCPSSQQCVGVGAGPGGAAIVSTTDGGGVWVARRPPAGVPDLYAVSCPSASTCAAVGSGLAVSGSSVQESGFVVVSRNKGASWTAGRAPGGIAFLSAVSCSTPSVCLAAGRSVNGQPVVIRTTDGGAAWHATSLPSVARALNALVDTSTTTTVTGSTTTTAPPVTTTTAPPVTTTTAPPVTTTTAPPVTTTTAPPVTTTTAPPVTTTVPPVSTTTAPPVTTTTTTRPVTTTTAPPATTTTLAPVAVTVPVTGMPSPPSPGGLAYSGADPYGAWCVGSSCWVVSDDAAPGGYIARTGNGGAAWSSESGPGPSRSTLAGVACPTATLCWAVGEDSGDGHGAVAFVSTNGGRSWTDAALPPSVTGTGGSLWGLSCPTASLCRAVGERSGGSGAAILLLRIGALTSDTAVVPRVPLPDHSGLIVLLAGLLGLNVVASRWVLRHLPARVAAPAPRASSPARLWPGPRGAAPTDLWVHGGGPAGR